MNTKFIKLISIEVEDNSLKYNFTYSKELSKFFNAVSLRITYDLSLYPFSLKEVPQSVLTTVFLGNMLPIAWLEDAELIVDSVDKKFFESIDDIKRGYKEMYPNLRFLGKVTCKNIEYNIPRPLKRNMCFFSLGVDAWQTLISNRNKNIMLFTMIGADFYLDKTNTHNAIQDHIQKVATDFNTEYIIFYTNLRKVINEENLNKKYQTALGFHWWHRIEHGMPVIIHSFPIAYLLGSTSIYFASSYSFKDAVIHKCATAPTIDNFISAVNFNVIHDGYQFTRQDKIFNICNFSNENKIETFIHVCWGQFNDIHNCSKCEKCLRTIFGILAEGYDPNQFGLKYDKNTNNMIKKLLTSDKLPLTEEMWEQIVFRFKMNIGILNERKELAWIKDFNYENRLISDTTSKESKQKLKLFRLFTHK